MKKGVKPGMSQKDLEQLLQKCLDEVPIDFIRRVARKCDRYMDAYRKGATGRLADFANNKYSSHRCLPDSWFAELKGEYENQFGEKAEESMIKMKDIEAPRPELGEFGVEEEEVDAHEDEAEEGEQPASSGEEETDDEGGDEAGQAEMDVELESESSDSDDAAAQENEARKEKQVRAANAQIAVMEERGVDARADEGGEDAHERTKRRQTAVNYSENVLSQRYFF
jgi:hypothetical protein